jgi:hypothetical protein
VTGLVGRILPITPSGRPQKLCRQRPWLAGSTTEATQHWRGKALGGLSDCPPPGAARRRQVPTRMLGSQGEDTGARGRTMYAMLGEKRRAGRNTTRRGQSALSSAGLRLAIMVKGKPQRFIEWRPDHPSSLRQHAPPDPCTQSSNRLSAKATLIAGAAISKGQLGELLDLSAPTIPSPFLDATR